MSEGEGWFEVRLGLGQVDRRGGDAFKVVDELRDLTAAPIEQQLEQPESLRLRAPPRSDHLASNPITEEPLALDHQDARALACQRRRERRAGEAPADDEQVEIGR
jgi:hypothetical protein